MSTSMYNDLKSTFFRYSHKSFMVLLILIGLIACKESTKLDNTEVDLNFQKKEKVNQVIETPVFIAEYSMEKVLIDGEMNEPVWSKQDWYDLNHVWMGEPVDPSDYYGKFKLAYDRDYLYVLVAVTDDFLNPTLRDGVGNYWKGDYVEVFIDEDLSGGDHKFNHQAFAYHVTTEGHAIDQSMHQEPIFFDHHIKVKRTQNGNKYLWELAIQLYDNTYEEDSNDNVPLVIKPGKKIGFSMAYGDNDGKATRENFLGSIPSHGINNDEGYTNSSVFGTLTFK